MKTNVNHVTSISSPKILLVHKAANIPKIKPSAGPTKEFLTKLTITYAAVTGSPLPEAAFENLLKKIKKTIAIPSFNKASLNYKNKIITLQLSD